jgi:L-aspartate oxidase
MGPLRLISDIPLSSRSELDLGDVRSSLRSVMWRHVGIIREAAHLDDVADMFGFWSRYTLDKIFDERSGWETQNMLLVGALITQAARWRAESRGTHFRSDAPEPSAAFAVHDVRRRGESAPRAIPADSPSLLEHASASA